MHRDANGLEVTAASATAVQAFDQTLMGYLGAISVIVPTRPTAWRRCSRLTPVRTPIACKARFAKLLSDHRAALPVAEVVAADAQRLTVHATSRERAHVTAQVHWIDGDPDHAAAVWEGDWLIIRVTCCHSAWRISSTSGSDVRT